MKATFYQDNKSKKEFTYEAPSGIWMTLKATSVTPDDYGNFVCETGLTQTKPSEYAIVVQAIPGFSVKSFTYDLTKVSLFTEEDFTIEVGDVIAYYIVAKLAKVVRVNSKKDLE